MLECISHVSSVGPLCHLRTKVTTHERVPSPVVSWKSTDLAWNLLFHWCLARIIRARRWRHISPKYQLTWDDSTFHNYCCENLKCYIVVILKKKMEACELEHPMLYMHCKKGLKTILRFWDCGWLQMFYSVLAVLHLRSCKHNKPVQ